MYDRQQQLISVLVHHAVYIGERVDIWNGLDKEKVIRSFTSNLETSTPLDFEPESKPYGSNFASHTMHDRFSSLNGHGKAGNSFNRGSMVPENTSRAATEHCNQPLEETSVIVPPAGDQRKGELNRTKLCAEADTVSEQEVDWGIVQRHLTAKFQPEDRYWILTDYSHTGRTISTIAAAPLAEQQPDAACGWCGSFQISYKPSQGVVSCDICSTPYQQNTPTPSGWDPGQYRSTDRSLIPASGLDTSQGDSTNAASWPDVTRWSSYGNDIDDFSWFMAS